MTQRNSLSDVCDVYISRHKNDQSSAGPGLISDLRSSWGHLLLSRPDQNGPRLPLPEPGCGCSPNAVTLPKFSRYGQSLRVPRPRNAFILFRCDFVHQRKLNPTENEDNNISRVAGQRWSQMTLLEKQPWLRMAQNERERHALLYPNYKYTPNPLNFKLRKTKIRGYNPHLHKAVESSALGPTLPANSQPQPRLTRTNEQINSHPLDTRPYPHPPERRPSSCPPIGATPVPDLRALESWLPPLVSQDDLRRRPSQTVMYQSTPTLNTIEPTSNDYLPLLQKNDSWLGVPQPYPWRLAGNEQLIQHNPVDSEFPVASAPMDSDPTYAAFSKQLDALSDIEFLSLEPTFVDPFRFSLEPTDCYPFQASDIPPFLTCADLGLPSSTLSPSSGPSLLSERRGGFSIPSPSTFVEDG